MGFGFAENSWIARSRLLERLEDVRRRPVDIDPVDRLKAFAGFRLLRFEDADGISEWDPQPTPLVRMVAQKRP